MQTQYPSHEEATKALAVESRGFTPSPARFLPKEAIAACVTYRDAVRLAWENRAMRGMTQRTLAEHLEIPGSHLSNMLCKDGVDANGKPRQDLPARLIADYQRVLGNWAVSQWMNRQTRLTIMEEVINSQGNL
jgi:hypothetical protein